MCANNMLAFSGRPAPVVIIQGHPHRSSKTGRKVESRPHICILIDAVKESRVPEYARHRIGSITIDTGNSMMVIAG
jgi:hypothetical protein